MAMNPAHANFDHGWAGKHGLAKVLCALGNMCTNAVAKITPAANALEMKKRFPSVLRNLRFRPRRGNKMPRALAVRMVAIAAPFKCLESTTSRQAKSVVGPQSPILASEFVSANI